MPVSGPDVPVSINEAKAAVRIAAGVESAKVAEGLFISGSNEEAVVKAFSEHVQAGRAREALSTAATRFTHESTWQQTADAQTSTDFDVGGKRINRSGSDEATRLDLVKTTTKTYIDYLKFGYDDIPDIPGEKTGDQKRADLLVHARRAVDSNPVLRDALGAGGPPPIVDDSSLRVLLRNKALANGLAKALNASYDSTALPSDLETQLMGEKTKLAKQDVELVQLRTKEANLRTEKARQEARGADFKAAVYISRSGIGMYTKEIVLERLGADSEVREYLEAKKNYEQLKAREEGHDATVSRTDVENARASMLGLQSPKTQEYDGLQAENQDINSMLEKANKELETLSPAVAQKTAERAKQQVAIDAIINQRTAKSREFTESIENAFSEMVQTQLTTEAANLIANYRVKQAEALSAVSAKHQDALRQFVDKRYIVTNKGKPELSRTMAQGDVNILFDPAQGPDKLVEKMLTQMKIPDEEKALMLQDKAFMTAQGKELATKAIAALAGSGVTLETKHIRNLMLTSWGKEIFGENDKAKTFLEEAKSSGAIKDASMTTLLEKHGSKGLYLLLLAILGLGAGASGLLKG